MKKVMLFALSAFLLPLLVNADSYKIVNMNSSSIKIGNKVCKTGDVFSDQEIIHWDKDNQAFKAQNLKTKDIRLYAESEFKQYKSKTLKDYFIRTNRLSTRGGMGLSELKDYLADEFLLFDTIHIESTEIMDKKHYFLVSYQMDGKTISKKLKGDNGKFIVTRSLFPKNASVSEFMLTISYVNKNTERDYHITDSMKVILLPLKIAE